MSRDLARLLLGTTRATGPTDGVLDEVLAHLPPVVTGVEPDERVRTLTLHLDGTVTEADLLATCGPRTDIGGLPTADGTLLYAQVLRARPPVALVAYRTAPGAPLAHVTVVWPGAGGGPELHPATGTVRVLGRVIGPGTTRLAADTLRVDGAAYWTDSGTDSARLEVDAGAWRVSLDYFRDYHGDALSMVSLYSVEPRAGDFDEAAEQDRRARHDAWLAGTEHLHPWGTVWSGYDDRAGFSEIRIRYPPPTEHDSLL